MNISELEELFLTVLYDRAEREGHDRIFSLGDIAKEMDVQDMGKVRKACENLRDMNWIENLMFLPNRQINASISGEGCRLVENGGKTGIIEKFRKDPTKYTINIDKSTHFSGHFSQSNIASHSSKFSQNTSVDQVISDMLSSLKNDPSLNIDTITDLCLDVETIKLQLSKKEKDETIMMTLLNKLGKVVSIASLVLQLKTQIGL